MKRTEIKTVGEFGLIEKLTSGIETVNASTFKGVGDDCAVLGIGSTKTLVTTDLLLEGIHFDLTYTPLRHLGYKAVAVNVSDVVAMNGKAEQITVAIGVSKRFSVEMLEELYDGIYLACAEFGVDLIGGDTSASMTGLTLCITCIGSAEEEKITCRSGAKYTDLVCVSGNIGAAYMGLQLLEREKLVFQGNEAEAQPDFDGYDYILERFLKPSPRVDIVKQLENAGIVPTSMIDISDGLSSELIHICKQSKVGCRVYEERLPIDYQTAKMAEELNMNLTTVAINGGEDYELLFTVPLSMHDKVLELDDVKIIGHIAEEHHGLYLVTRGDNEIEIMAQGWNALKE